MTQPERQELEKQFREKGKELAARVKNLKGRVENVRAGLSSKGSGKGWMVSVGAVAAATVLGMLVGNRRSTPANVIASKKVKKRRNDDDPLVREAIRSGKSVIIYRPRAESPPPEWQAPLKSVASVAVAEMLRLGADILTNMLEQRANEVNQTPEKNTGQGDQEQ